MKRVLIYLCGVLTLWSAWAAQASVVILGTRAIYPADQKSINVQLTNEGDSPSLVQAWMDSGDAASKPDSVKVPFLITPPLSRLNGGQGQTLRIVHTGEALPQDRESLYYLNVLDIPPKPKFDQADGKAQNTNYLQLAIRSRIKFFYRPQNLSPSVSDAYAQVRWALRHEGGKTVVQIHNPTPYFITFNSIGVKQGSKVAKVEQSDMVAPFSDVSYPIKGVSGSQGTVQWAVVNDYGGISRGETALVP